MQRIITAAAALGLLLVCSPAHAENVHEVGGVTSTGNWNSYCFGGRLQVDLPTSVLHFDMSLKNSLGKTITYYVYENTANSNLGWDRIDSATTTKTGTVSNAAFGWENGPPLYAEMEAGKYYSVVACWSSGATSVHYASLAPEELPFGTMLQSTYAIFPGSLDGDNDTLYGWSVDFHMRFRTAAGEPIDVEPPTGGGYSGPYTGNYMRGNVYSVDTDSVLLGFDQRYRVNSSSSVQWAVYECPGTGPSCSSTWTLVSSGTTTTTYDSNNVDQWLKAEDVQVQLTAGNKYWVGYLGNSATGYWRWTLSSPNNLPADPSWGETLGMYYKNTSSLPTTTSFTGPWGSYVTPQHLNTLDTDADEIDGTTTCCSIAYYHQGSVFSVSSATRIEQFAVEIDPTADETVTFGIYTGASETGPFTLQASHPVEIQGTDPLKWIESGTFDYDIVPSDGFVVLAVGFGAGSHARGWNLGMPPNPTVTFGTYERLTYGAISGGGLPTTLTPSNIQNTWSTRVESCATCADYDNDGVTAATDCDDEDALNYPGNTEVCDLQDNDCDGTVDEGFDADGDGVTTCAGDCDDTDPLNYPGNSETCDAQDNDCDGGIDEGWDADGDGVTECGPDGVYGNPDDDCDDTDSFNFPTNSESCDGQDNDCDVAVDEDFDLDGDTYPDQDISECADNLPSGSLDCDDTSTTVNPGASEACNTVDDDCDGAVDEDFDVDNDNYFDEDLCSFGDDCNDSVSTINPGATEQCNGIDDNCDNVVPSNEADADADSYRICAGDCLDTVSQVNPGASEACDGYDTNCSGGLGTGVGEPNELDADSDDYYVCAPYETWGNPLFGGDDCDDGEVNANPGAAEVCDGIDNDCDGVIDEDLDNDGDGETTCAGDCDDNDENVYTGAPEICDGKDSNCDGNIAGTEQDSDGDGYIDCTLDGDANPPLSVVGGDDCNDTVAAVNPGADEVCDGWDNDCDGAGETDGDGDEFLTCDPFVNNGAPDISGGNDCDDSEATAFPGNTEICDQIDNDCDGTVDDGFDNDSDNFFAGAGCDSYYADVDCNDSNASVYPGAPEACNGVDDDCDVAVDEDYDVDGDTFFDDSLCGFGTDCDDTDAAVNPDATEVCDAIDNDCDATIDEGFDADADGYWDAVDCSFGDDCDDGDPDQFPGATEVCNAEDDDCDGTTDEGFDADGDGYWDEVACSFGDDCDDEDATQNPGASEVCNGADDDCDGVIPDGQPDGEVDDDEDGYFECEGDCDDAAQVTYPGASELCDLADNDCDGTTDEGFDADGDGYFDVIACETGQDCADNDAAINPDATEVCDGLDNDCNATVDDGFDADGDGFFDAAEPDCVTAYGEQADCNDADPAIAPFTDEICDAVDQDCDGDIDEDFDADLDGYFDAADEGCENTYADTDCDDNEETVYDGAAELCDAVDNDCDLDVDEDYDVDLDGYYDGDDQDCAATYGESADCADGDDTVYPGAAELCDGLDNDCDGAIPGDETDGDGDGFNECADGDCDDADPAQYVGATELCNAEDDDCDGAVDNGFDADGDSYFDGDDAFCASTYGEDADCDDGDVAVNPGADELCNAEDDDCDGSIDEDFDLDLDGAFEEVECAGVYGDTQLDCDDGEAEVNPLQIEDCTNGIDDNCDGDIDIDEDGDGDGVTTCGGDCDDDDPNVFPGATEACNLLDDDCDGELDEDFDFDLDGFFDELDAGCAATYASLDCNDNDDATFPGADELCDTFDQDCDGSVDEDFDLDADGFFAGDGCDAAYADVDCDDVAPGTFPGATEVCNVADDDCDGDIDEDFDVDADGFFDAADGGCAANYGTDADCDDALDDVFPAAPELCDGLDNDCNGAVPPDEVDNDLDGYVECETPEADHVGTPAGGGDCDDGDNAVLPGAAEICNVVDDDCDGAVDEDFDADGDGYVDQDEAACEAVYETALDCDDTNADVFPDQAETCNALDDDCNNFVDDGFDLDDDGWVDGSVEDCAAAYADTDCDDADAAVFPFNFEDCTNGIDDNCNGEIDEDTDDDGDGFTTCDGDCNDDDASIYLGALEICDGVDQDCDFAIDEDFDFDGDGYTDATACPEGLDCDDGDADVSPGADELCNAVDDDCDGAVDEIFDLDGDGSFDRFVADCLDTYGGADTDCDDSNPNVSPEADELCNDLDDDCDGLTDDGFDLDGDGVWAATDDCETTYGSPLDCDDNDDTVYPEYDGNPAAEEVCDGLDTDCDGVIPEDADEDGYVDGDRADCVEAFEEDELDCDDADGDVNPGADEVCDDEADNDCDGDVDLDDADCIEGDDDDSGDDDDATDDDDDVVDELDPPGIVDNEGWDRPEIAAGCSSCRSDLGGGGGAAPWALGFLLLGGLALRRSRRRAGLTGLVVAGLLLVAAAPAFAQGALESEAARQLDFAWAELEKGEWDKAISSADSALRLNPALYTAMVVKALAYEGKGELRRAESWLQTYLDLTANLSRAPEATDLADRLKDQLNTGGNGNGGQVKATSTVTVGKDYGAFGDGYVLLGGLLGGRGYSHTPCSGGEGCEAGEEARPGWWAFSGAGFGGGGSLRAEYFFAGWLLGARLRYDLGAAEPVGHWDVASGSRPSHRLDFNVVFRVPLLTGLTKLHLLADVGYGLRSWTVYENVSETEATSFSFAGSQLGGGVGVRVEPGRLIGIEGRFGVGGLLGGAGGLNDYGVEVGAVIRPVQPLLIRAAFDLRATHWLAERDGAAVEVRDLVAGVWIGAGVVF